MCALCWELSPLSRLTTTKRKRKQVPGFFSSPLLSVSRFVLPISLFLYQNPCSIRCFRYCFPPILFASSSQPPPPLAFLSSPCMCVVELLKFQTGSFLPSCLAFLPSIRVFSVSCLSLDLHCSCNQSFCSYFPYHCTVRIELLPLPSELALGRGGAQPQFLRCAIFPFFFFFPLCVGSKLLVTHCATHMRIC